MNPLDTSIITSTTKDNLSDLISFFEEKRNIYVDSPGVFGFGYNSNPANFFFVYLQVIDLLSQDQINEIFGNRIFGNFNKKECREIIDSTNLSELEKEGIAQFYHILQQGSLIFEWVFFRQNFLDDSNKLMLYPLLSEKRACKLLDNLMIKIVSLTDTTYQNFGYQNEFDMLFDIYSYYSNRPYSINKIRSILRYKKFEVSNLCHR